MIQSGRSGQASNSWFACASSVLRSSRSHCVRVCCRARPRSRPAAWARGWLPATSSTAPAPAWGARRVGGGGGGEGGEGGLEPPFVGRDEELRLLKEQLHAAERESR